MPTVVAPAVTLTQCKDVIVGIPGQSFGISFEISFDVMASSTFSLASLRFPIISSAYFIRYS